MAFPIPSMLLKQLYTFGSLANGDSGVRFSLKNRLSDGTVTGLHHVKFDGVEVPRSALRLEMSDGVALTPDEVRSNPIDFPLRRVIDIVCDIAPLPIGIHHIEVKFDAKPFGTLTLKVEGSIQKETEKRTTIPARAMTTIRPRQSPRASTSLRSSAAASTSTSSNTHSIHTQQTATWSTLWARRRFRLGWPAPWSSMASTRRASLSSPWPPPKGTLVASYNRGMKVINLSGGCRVTVSGDGMQRAPVFVFDDALQARDFSLWVAANFERIAEMAEATSSVAKLLNIEPFLASKFAYLRFTYSTGDAAGQNMVGRATFAACGWIVDNYEGVRHFYLESNLATDKKASHVNVMRTRGKRVIAEATIKRDVLLEQLRVEPETLLHHHGVGNVGSLLSGANNNGAHSANGITATFIAMGQDVANVSESSAGILYAERTPAGDLYLSMTIPSLIVATYGGGTGLATQRECLEMIGCYGKDKVNKLAEIIGGVVLAGELSLAAAISSSDWVSSHERYGRNR